MNYRTVKITTYEELDRLIPVITEFHATQKYCTFFPHSGYLAWLTVNFPNLGIWVVYAGEDIACYVIVSIQANNLVKEALVYEAYSVVKDFDVTTKTFSKIEEWAKQNGCRMITCYTEREKDSEAFYKRYGFEIQRVCLSKRL